MPPAKVAWLHPVQLLRTAYQAALSTLATGFLDRRETFAAIPPTRTLGESDSSGTASHSGSHRFSTWLVRSKGDPNASDTPAHLTLHSSLVGEDVWIDYVADIGDSWDATYASLSMLARGTLTVRGLDSQRDSPGQLESPGELESPGQLESPSELPRAHILVLGGDEVYPTPSRMSYRTRTRSALMAALPAGKERRPPALLAIPGNHDWYDGLTAFTREFCQGRGLAGWRLVQGRSYFAARLHTGWWLLGIDIALDSRIDETQRSYFLQVLTPHPGDRVILCTAKPVWLDGPFRTTEAYRNLAEFADVIRLHGLTTSVILAGDTHHYSHYARIPAPATANSGSTPEPTAKDAEEEPRVHPEHMIVCGGGGSYLAATHQLKPAVLRVMKDPSGDEHGERHMTESEQPFALSPHTYPPRDVSARLSTGAVALALKSHNWPFVVTIGVIYSLFLQTLHQLPAARVLMTRPMDDFIVRVRALAQAAPGPGTFAGLLMVLVCALFTLYANDGRRVLRLAWGTAHGASHAIVALWLMAWGIYFRHSVDLRAIEKHIPEVLRFLPIDFLLWRAGFVLVAGFVGATLVGVFFALSDRLFGWHTNEAFVAQSIVDYRSVLRIRLSKDGTLTIFPIGLRRVPRRWRARPADCDTRTGPLTPTDGDNPSLYEPGDAVLAPHLIEAPIKISS